MTDPAFAVSQMRPSDGPAVERLCEQVFGPGRYAKTSYRLREGRAVDASLALVVHVGTRLVGASRMSEISIGKTPALLLGPLAVEPAFRQLGLGERLVQNSLALAREKGFGLVVLVGEPAYYKRMGFVPVPEGQVRLPGPVDPERLLYCETIPGAAQSARGLARASGPMAAD